MTVGEFLNQSNWDGMVEIADISGKVIDYFNYGGRKMKLSMTDTEIYLHYKDFAVMDATHNISEDKIVLRTSYITTPAEIALLKLQEQMIEVSEWAKSTQIQVIFNPPATMLYKNDKKYVAKCDSADTFDEEKGLMLCLLKSCGYTYSNIERLLKGAKRFGDKE